MPVGGVGPLYIGILLEIFSLLNALHIPVLLRLCVVPFHDICTYWQSASTWCCKLHKSWYSMVIVVVNGSYFKIHVQQIIV